MQEREAARVLVECCLSEAAYNPFYAAVAVRLCLGDPTFGLPYGSGDHPFTFQLCFWDLFKLPTEELSTRRAASAAKLLASVTRRDLQPRSPA
jgi:nucleolar MIF4G domain-containing protein 1